MKRVYWRPRAVSQAVVVLVAILALSSLLAVEFFKADVRQPYYEEKASAVKLSHQCMKAIRKKRLDLAKLEAKEIAKEIELEKTKQGEENLEEPFKPREPIYPIDRDIDPANTGMIGKMMTNVTTIAGHLPSKQTTTNPNFAAVVVEMLRQAGVKEGDKVAVGCSGSFPALNTSVYAALETLGAAPVIIASAGASQFGANFPELLWIDMEKELQAKKLISFRAVACSIGGYEDLGVGMDDAAKKLIIKAIKDRNGLQLLQPQSTSTEYNQQGFQEAIDKRMAIYEANAEGRTYKAYINVGGGTISVGRSVGKKLFNPGLNLRARQAALQVDSVMSRFMREGVPVLHLVQVDELANAYGLPLAPTEPRISEGKVILEGTVFEKRQYRRWLAACLLVVLLVSLRALVLTDLGFRLFRGQSSKKAAGEPEPMV